MKNQTKVELPKFIVEKSGAYWQIWNTTIHEVTKTFETKDNAELWLRDSSRKF